MQAVEADIAFANAGGVAEWFSQGPLPLLSPPPPPPPSPSPLPTSIVRRAEASASSHLTLRRDRAAEGEKGTKASDSGGRRGEGHQQARRRRSRPARARTAGNAAFGDRARTEQEGDRTVEKRPLLPLTATKRKPCFISQAMCRSVGTAAAGRGTTSGGARRPTVPSGDATTRASTITKRRQRGAGGHGGGGGGDPGRRPPGRTSVASFSSGRTEGDIARRTRADHRLESATAAATAGGVSHSSLRLRVPQPARLKSARPAGAEAQTCVRRRSAPKVGVTSAVARFGAPTAASSGKDRRREGEEQRSGAIPREGGAYLEAEGCL